jgi:hypothetical protein
MPQVTFRYLASTAIACTKHQDFFHTGIVYWQQAEGQQGRLVSSLPVQQPGSFKTVVITCGFYLLQYCDETN